MCKLLCTTDSSIPLKIAGERSDSKNSSNLLSFCHILDPQEVIKQEITGKTLLLSI